MPNNKNSLAGRFIASHRQFPSHNALHVNGSYYTYEQLYQMACSVVAQFRSKAKSPRIGIYCTESAWTYASILAISISGASYVPLNPKFPPVRLKEIVDACGLDLVLTEVELEIEGPEQCIIKKDPGRQEQVEDLFQSTEAYLLFTSGSTGRPKGVPISHRNLAGFFDHFDKNFQFTPADRFLQPFDLSFDVSVMMTFLAWTAGACVYVVPEEGSRPFNILSTIRDHQVTVCAMVPSVLSYIGKYLPEVNLPLVRYTFFAGERFYTHLAEKWQVSCPNARIFNAYGPTEATIVCIMHEYSPASMKSYGADIPIGKPFRGTKVMLIDEAMKEMRGIPGELCLSGVQVAGHYLGNVEDERFFMRGDDRYYRTGDNAVMNAQGDLVFLGRLDEQVKINGYRVELVEVAGAITNILKKKAVVLAVNEGPADVLVAFIEGNETADLQKELVAVLPAYMIPARIISLEQFPMGMHDKVDEKRLVQLYHERNHT